jgi:3-dehydroquinate dehydratase/shikimate dehydrogenase
MICISVTPTSRKLAKVDLLNAARQGDIVELCLDHLAKEPDIKDLLSATNKPIIISCRRKQDGGAWEGTEDERLLLLRQAIVAGPAFVELDLDIAPKVPRFGKTQRIISFVRIDRPEHDIDSIFDDAVQQQADVVKFTWPTPTLDDAWPLLVAVTQKRRLPIVGLGLGRADLTFSLLGLRHGSPWIYAALEKGMESFSGQATVFELDEIYHWREIDKKTMFIAIAGFGDSQTATTRIFNAAFKQQGMNVRCLPIEVGEIRQLRKMLDALKIRALICGRSAAKLAALVEEQDERDAQSGWADLLLKKTDDKWHGSNSVRRAGLAALEAQLGLQPGSESSLERLNVLVLGTGGAAPAFIQGCVRRKGLVSICGPNDKESQKLAAALNCRFVPFQNVYSTLADVVVIADAALQAGTLHGCLNPALLKPGMTVLDVSDPPSEHPLFEEARLRGCRLVEPAAVYAAQVGAQFKAISGKDLPTEAVAQGLAAEG